ncbi:hypothetical protein KIW84_034500 [Lathyrus oleraceus]|uniref:Retroviral polymerase SH3-like domain-containing protein n=1 Tax=Pisum sativum TaxID=3888 RepID=A0A9D5AZG8_PEA|nr:hypothetical protein KIW84_034500 [Pisum sativum]
MLTPQFVESSTLLVEKSSIMFVDQKKFRETYVEKKGEGVWCTYCNKPRHTREKCWKLIGQPPNREWGLKRDLFRKGGHAHMARSTSEDSLEGWVHLNLSEVEKVRSLLSKLEKVSGYSSTKKGYKCYHPPSHKFFVSRDLTFHEQESYFVQTHLQGENVNKEYESLILPNLTLETESDSKNDETDVRYGKNLVYTRRKTIPESTHI